MPRTLHPAMNRFLAIGYGAHGNARKIGSAKTMAAIVRVGRDAIATNRTACVDIVDAKTRQTVQTLTTAR